jgi:hypothetical protein
MRFSNQTTLHTSHELDFDVDLLPQILALFPADRLHELKEKLFQEVREELNKETHKGPDRPHLGQDFREIQSEFHWSNPKSLSESPLSRRDPRQFPNDQMPDTSYYSTSGASFNFEPAFSTYQQFPLQDYISQTPITNSQETSCGGASQQRDDLYSGFQMANPMAISREEPVDRRIGTPSLPKNTHPSYPAGPVQRSREPSRTFPPHPVRRFDCDWLTVRGRSLRTLPLWTHHQIHCSPLEQIVSSHKRFPSCLEQC